MLFKHLSSFSVGWTLIYPTSEARKDQCPMPLPCARYCLCVPVGNLTLSSEQSSKENSTSCLQEANLELRDKSCPCLLGKFRKIEERTTRGSREGMREEVSPLSSLIWASTLCAQSAEILGSSEQVSSCPQALGRKGSFADSGLYQEVRNIPAW